MNEGTTKPLSLSKHTATVLPQGQVIVSLVTRLKTTCSVNLQKFPFDVQTCYIYITANIHNKYISLQRTTIPFMQNPNKFYGGNTEWKNIQYKQTVNAEIWEDEVYAITIDVLELKITMERNPVFYIIFLIIPSVLMAFVSVLVFLLPPESGERVGLSITVLLSYTVFLLMVSEITPKGGSNTSLFGKNSKFICI